MIAVMVMLLAVSYANGFAADQDVKPLPSIEVTEPKDVASLAAIDKTLDALAERVTACVTSGSKREACLCSDPEAVIRLRRGYTGLIERHPDWKDQLLSFQYRTDQGRTISGTLVLRNLRRQLDVLKCE